MSITSKLCREGQQLYRRIHTNSQSLDGNVSLPADILARRGNASVSQANSRSSLQNEQYYSSPKVPYGKLAQQKEADREFFTDLLSSAATKRDAKAYLSRFKKPTEDSKSKDSATRTPGSYVNVGNLFRGSRAAEMSPVFVHGPPAQADFQQQDLKHVALVKLKDVTQMSRQTLLGVAETLMQLNRLSLSPCVVIESSTARNRHEISVDADILLAALNEVGNPARVIDGLFCTNWSGEIRVPDQRLLSSPMQKEVIPIVLPSSYDEQTQRVTLITATVAVLALTRELAGLSVKDQSGGMVSTAADRHAMALDRIISIDSAGGISNDRAADGRHVFINLEQEYPVVSKKLSDKDSRAARTQLDNLNMLKEALQLLPSTASGLMTTFEEAANHERKNRLSSGSSYQSSVGTRRQKNALIHNLLTDKPAYSASLPLGRLGKAPDTNSTAELADATSLSCSSFVKRGMPLTILPDPFKKPWTADSARLKLTDARVDLARLVHLIDDSFDRKLDVKNYLARVNEKIAGIIIAGEYEGGAILTWETPPNNPSAPPVPYLDKFAVLKRSQGAGGVADIVFNAMVRSCFPGGVCWRSRRNNPVNKWYFERSAGTWKIDHHWCMFWTGEGIETDQQRFRDYISVCQGVQPTWLDKKKPAD